MNNSNETAYSPEEIQHCISFLENLATNSGQIVNLSEAQRIALMTAAGQLTRPDRRELKKRNKEKNRVQRQVVVQYERNVRAATGIRRARQASVFSAPVQIPDLAANLNSDSSELKSPRNCYVCKAEFTKLHFFYDAMCPSCAAFNYQKRFQTASLDGQVALITGARVKIGFQTTLMMLRAGARVIATTRFPVDAAMRFTGEKDFSEWGDRLHIYGLDLRHTPSVEIFSSFIERNYDRLDILINNAAQTVRRPPGFYTHLLDNETSAIDTLPENVRSLLGRYHLCVNQLDSFSAPNIGPNSGPNIRLEPALPVTWNGKAPGIGLRASAKLSQIPYTYDHSLVPEAVFPKGELDADLQQVDLRETNSWRLRIGEIQTSEMLEIQLVNAVAPFVLCNRLVPMMRRDYTGKKHIVNVTAMEGKFFRFKTTGRHPHTNMAKAALNMLTHASAADLARDGIFMNAVDTGWVTDEDPAKLASLKQELHDFQPPLDIVDGAARICDPFFHGILTDTHWCGKFLKDYQPIDW